MNELVSVIIPVYNRENTILRAIKSVLNQTYENIEVIVIDDCSSDNTETLILKYYNDNSKVYYEKLKRNSGACVARNRGIEVSNGKYIAFLDSDDIFLENKIEIQVKAITETPCDLCATAYDRIGEKGTKRINIKKCNGENLYRELLYCNFITTGTLMGKRECFEKIKFDERLPRYQDWDLVLRLCRAYKFVLMTDSTLIQEEQRNSITTSTGHKKTFDAMKIIYEKNKEGFAKYVEADTQFKWLMGVHSIFLKNDTRYDLLWYGCKNSGLKINRLFVLLAAKVGMKDTLDRMFR